MKRSLLFLLLVFGTLTALSARQATSLDVTGAWDMSLEMSNGSMPVSLHFTKQEADILTGTLSSPQGDVALTGKVTGVEITFGGKFEANGQSIPLSFVGKIENDTMSGTAEFGGMGTATWTAKRNGH